MKGLSQENIKVFSGFQYIGLHVTNLSSYITIKYVGPKRVGTKNANINVKWKYQVIVIKHND